jgi:hypothetical protein
VSQEDAAVGWKLVTSFGYHYNHAPASEDLLVLKAWISFLFVHKNLRHIKSNIAIGELVTKRKPQTLEMRDLKPLLATDSCIINAMLMLVFSISR